MQQSGEPADLGDALIDRLRHTEQLESHADALECVSCRDGGVAACEYQVGLKGDDFFGRFVRVGQCGCNVGDRGAPRIARVLAEREDMRASASRDSCAPGFWRAPSITTRRYCGSACRPIRRRGAASPTH
jgi:hypothetical protein